MTRCIIRTILAIALLFGLTLPAPAAVQDKGQSQPAHSAPPPPPPPPPAVHSAPPPPPQVHASGPPPSTVPRSTPATASGATSGDGGPSGHSRGGSSGTHSGGQGGGSTGTARRSGSSGHHTGTAAVTRGESHGRTAAANSPVLGTTNGTRARGDRTPVGTAVARQVPPHGGGGGGYYPYYPIYYPGFFYPYAFGYWDPFWWGGDPYWGAGGYDVYGGGGGGYADSGQSDEYGALKIKVKPSDAQVYVDGYFAGLVDDYDGMFQKLKLPVGEHHIELRDEGHVPLEFDVHIEYDQTVTYKGEMQKIVSGTEAPRH